MQCTNSILIFTRSHTLQGKLKHLYYYKGATLTLHVSGGTVRRDSGGKRPEKRCGCTGNVIAFGSEGDVNDNRTPKATLKSYILPMKIPPIRCRRKHVMNSRPLADIVCCVSSRPHCGRKTRNERVRGASAFPQ